MKRTSDDLIATVSNGASLFFCINKTWPQTNVAILSCESINM